MEPGRTWPCKKQAGGSREGPFTGFAGHSGLLRMETRDGSLACTVRVLGVSGEGRPPKGEGRKQGTGGGAPDVGTLRAHTLESNRPGLKSQRHILLAVWLYAGNVSSLRSSFFICNNEIREVPMSSSCYGD